MDSESWTERLKLCMREGGWKQETLSKELGISRGAVGHYVSGNRSPHLKHMAMLARIFEVSLHWLVTGEGPKMVLTAEEIEGLSNSVADGTFTLVPKHAVTASLGTGLAVNSEQIVDYLAFKTDWLFRKGLHARNLALISAAGDSMTPTISDGDLLLVELWQGMEQAKNGKIHVIRQDNQLYAKRIQRKLDGTLIIKSDNKEYEPEIVSPEHLDQVHILGHVAWIGRDI